MTRHVDLAADMAQVAAALATAGVTASVDAADLNAPGVQVRFRELDHEILAGYRLGLDLVLFVADTHPADAASALSILHNAVIDVWPPVGLVELVGFALPDSHVLPALRLPIDVYGTYPEE